MMHEFKVGDRVRWIHGRHESAPYQLWGGDEPEVGSLGTVVEVEDGEWINIVFDGFDYANSRLDPEGHHYVRPDGYESEIELVSPAKPSLYLSGPMSGIEDHNFPAFNRAAKYLRSEGYTVFNPAENFDGNTDLPRATYFKADFKALLECDEVVLLPGWRESEGALSEALMAIQLDMPIHSWLGPSAGLRMIPSTYVYDALTALGKRRVSNADIPAIAAQAVKPRDQEDVVTGDIVVVDDEHPTVEIDTGEEEEYQTEEVRVTSPTGGQKGSKPSRYDLIPSTPLDILARVYGMGAEKYDDNNWRKGYNWSLNFAAMQRHLWAFWSGENTDPESGLPHLAHAAWHCFALLQFSEGDEDYSQFDDRYKEGK